MNKTIYGSYGHRGEGNWIAGDLGFNFTPKLQDAGLLLLGGGADIDATLYTDKVSKRTGSFSPARDRAEVDDFRDSVNNNRKIIGICRGAQMICALSGGSLIQHVDNHCGDHDIDYIDGETTTMTSLHHQMLYPFRLPEEDYVILAKSRNNRARTYVLTDEEVYSDKNLPFEGFVEPEVVWFPKTNALAIQGHPEFMYRHGGESREAMTKIYQIFELFLEDKLASYVKTHIKNKSNVTTRTT